MLKIRYWININKLDWTLSLNPNAIEINNKKA